MKDTQN